MGSDQVWLCGKGTLPGCKRSRADTEEPWRAKLRAESKDPKIVESVAGDGEPNLTEPSTGGDEPPRPRLCKEADGPKCMRSEASVRRSSRAYDRIGTGRSGCTASDTNDVLPERPNWKAGMALPMRARLRISKDEPRCRRSKAKREKLR